MSTEGAPNGRTRQWTSAASVEHPHYSSCGDAVNTTTCSCAWTAQTLRSWKIGEPPPHHATRPLWNPSQTLRRAAPIVRSRQGEGGGCRPPLGPWLLALVLSHLYEDPKSHWKVALGSCFWLNYDSINKSWKFWPGPCQIDTPLFTKSL